MCVTRPLDEGKFVPQKYAAWVCRVVARVDGEQAALAVERHFWAWRGDLILSAKRQLLALGVYVHRLVSYIGAYVAVLGGTDVLVFTAGVGENAFKVRESVCDRLAPLGFWLDDEANETRSKDPRVISQPGSPVTIMVVPTNEELQMARETAQLL